AMPPGKAWELPQTRFCTAMAMPHGSRVSPRPSVTGRVNRPNEPRAPKPMAAMMQPATMTRGRGMAGRAGAVAMTVDIGGLGGGRAIHASDPGAEVKVAVGPVPAHGEAAGPAGTAGPGRCSQAIRRSA